MCSKDPKANYTLLKVLSQQENASKRRLSLIELLRGGAKYIPTPAFRLLVKIVTFIA